MLLYVVRHGDPIDEIDTLTERGRRQAEALGKRLKNSKKRTGDETCLFRQAKGERENGYDLVR